MQKNMTGYTFDHALVPSRADAALYRELAGRDRVIHGYHDDLDITVSDNNIVVHPGMFIGWGRLSEVTDNINLKPLDGVENGYIVAHIDLEVANDYSGTQWDSNYRFQLNQEDIRLVEEITRTDTIYDVIIGTYTTWGGLFVTKDTEFYTGIDVNGNHDAEVYGIPFLKNVIDEGIIPDNYTSSVPFIMKPAVVRNSNVQGIIFNNRTFEWYITQNDGLDPQGVIVIRQTASGEYISQMYLPGAGHGQQMWGWIDPTNGTQYIYWSEGAKGVFRTAYVDNTTVKTGDSAKELVYQESTPDRGYNHGFDIRGEMMGWRFQTGGKYYLYANRVNVNTAGDINIDSRQSAVIDISDQIPLDQAHSIQGTMVLKREDITGELDKDSGIYYIFVDYGWPNEYANIPIWEYNINSNTITFTDRTLTDLYKQLTRRPYEKAKYELEGGINISIPYGDGELHGLVFANSGGPIGGFNSYIHGFMSQTMVDLIRNVQVQISTDKWTSYIQKISNGGEKELWKLHQDMYTIYMDDMVQYTDLPSGINLVGNSYLFNSWHENYGDRIQTLWIQNAGKMDVYERFLNFQDNGYGSDYKPLSVSPWQKRLYSGISYGSINSIATPLGPDAGGISVRVGPSRVQIFIQKQLNGDWDITGEQQMFYVTGVPLPPGNVPAIGFLNNITGTTLQNNTGTITVNQSGYVAVNGSTVWTNGHHVRGEISWDY